MQSFALETQTSSVLTKHTNNELYAQNLPPSLSSKPNANQQKPTAYVRPMDGQDQAPNESPELKQSVDTDISYNNESYSGLSDAKIDVPGFKAMKERLTIPLSKEVKEMTHSWPPPLTAIHTPNKGETNNSFIPAKDWQHLGIGCNHQTERCDIHLEKLQKFDKQGKAQGYKRKLICDEIENGLRMHQKCT
ncbi:AF4/FMR2 family member 2-like [Cetorhinus maximus]